MIPPHAHPADQRRRHLRPRHRGHVAGDYPVLGRRRTSWPRRPSRVRPVTASRWLGAAADVARCRLDERVCRARPSTAGRPTASSWPSPNCCRGGPTWSSAASTPGPTSGINVIYSGTVAAAIEAAFLGLPAIAASLHLRRDIPTDFDHAATVARRAIDRVLAQRPDSAGQVANINVPALHTGEEPTGVRVARQCVPTPRPTPTTAVTDPRGRPYFWNSGEFTPRHRGLAGPTPAPTWPASATGSSPSPRYNST